MYECCVVDCKECEEQPCLFHDNEIRHKNDYNLEYCPCGNEAKLIKLYDDKLKERWM